jgi:hypothetical protein
MLPIEKVILHTHALPKQRGIPSTLVIIGAGPAAEKALQQYRFPEAVRYYIRLWSRSKQSLPLR